MTQPALPEHKSALSFEHVWVREAVFVDVEDDYRPLPADPGRTMSVKLEVKSYLPMAAIALL